MNERIEEEYKYGFRTDIDPILETGKGLSEDVIKWISKLKGEPDWMLQYRLKAYRQFLKMSLPSFGPDLSAIDFKDYVYFKRPSDGVKQSWDEVPVKIKDTFARLGIPEVERKFLAGVLTQFESEAVYTKMRSELESQGIIFCDSDTALKQYPELFKKYFGKAVSYADNKFAALNFCVWSGGSFIYVPKNVKVKKPLQSYFRINSQLMGQFEHTIVIVDEGSSLHYIEGCTAPIYSKDSLHAAVVEVFVNDNATCRVSSIQNWSRNIINCVTTRAICGKNSVTEFVSGNIGAKINMKYPTCVLKGDGSKGSVISVAFASQGQNQDVGAKMVHLGNNTSSSIVSKSVCRYGGKATYRGFVKQYHRAENAKSHVQCDTIILDEESASDTVPLNYVGNKKSRIEHEATVSRVSDDQLFYVMSRGIPKNDAMEMIVMGFLEPFTKELPMEYAVELNRLIKLEMTGAIG